MRSKEPGSWTVISEDWVLRFTGSIPKGLYDDYPEGAAERTELFSVKNDPGEAHNLIDQFPEVAASLKAVAAKQMKELPPPVKWNRTKWNELQRSLEN